MGEAAAGCYYTGNPSTQESEAILRYTEKPCLQKKENRKKFSKKNQSKKNDGGRVGSMNMSRIQLFMFKML